MEEDIYDLSDEELEQQEAEAEAERVRQELLESLACAIEDKFQRRARNRAAKEQQWIRADELYYGKLAFTGNLISRETPFELVSYANRPDVNIVRSKCNIAIAQTYSMQFGTGNKNWDLWPSKTNKDPANEQAASFMSATIEQQLEDCKYAQICWKGMRDRVIKGTCVLKGPTSVGKLVRTYRTLEGTSTWVPELTVDYSPELQYINPWFFYPDESVDNIKDIGDTIEIHPMSALDLKKLMQHEGFDASAIAEVLENAPEEYRENTWKDYAKLSENCAHLFKNKYLVIEYHGPITRTQLDKLEIEPQYDSLNDEYYGEVWVCDGKVIRVELEAIEASFRSPYYMSVWEKDPGSVFGYGVPLMMEDAQRVVNETWHMILDNSAQSSGVQVGMHKHLLEPANGKWELGPGQIWYVTDAGSTVQEALQFFVTPNVTSALIPVMQLAQGFAEEESGIPLITAGLQSPEAIDSATGQLVIHQASTTLLDFMSEEWDNCITEPIIDAWYSWNMQYNDDPSIKGQFEIDVRTSTQYKNKQLHIRDLEKLSVESAQNPNLAKFINMDQLTKLRLSMMNLPDKSIIKTDEQIAEEEAAAAANPQPNIELMNLELEARKLAIDEAKLQLEAQQMQQRELWEHRERMLAGQARFVESQARVAVSQNEKETEMIKLAQRSEEAAARLLTQEKIARENNQTKAFLAAMAESRKQEEVDTYKAELEYKRQTGDQGV